MSSTIPPRPSVEGDRFVVPRVSWAKRAQTMAETLFVVGLALLTLVMLVGLTHIGLQAVMYLVSQW